MVSGVKQPKPPTLVCTLKSHLGLLSQGSAILVQNAAGLGFMLRAADGKPRWDFRVHTKVGGLGCLTPLTIMKNVDSVRQQNKVGQVEK